MESPSALPAAPAEQTRYRRGTLNGANCAECPLAKDGKPHQSVTGVGPDEPLWIALGEGPGNEEVKMGLPFVGQTGQLLSRAFKDTAVNRGRLWVTNMTACHPRGANEASTTKSWVAQINLSARFISSRTRAVQNSSPLSCCHLRHFSVNVSMIGAGLLSSRTCT